MTIELKWKKLHPKAELPALATSGAACFDLRASLDEPLLVQPGEVVLIPTGLAVEIPAGYEMQIRSRSGLAAKNGFMLVNGIGTIDADYRGEIKAIATVVKKEALTIHHGDRICQALIAPVLRVFHTEVQELSDTVRGEQGFGSTGVAKV
jgi:dUTP pyrophosphatase